MQAIAEARRVALPFIEMLAHRDYIVHVLDADGRRESQMAALGGAIEKMVLSPSEYSPVLGSGIDAEAAVAAFSEAQHGVAVGGGASLTLPSTRGRRRAPCARLCGCARPRPLSSSGRAARGGGAPAETATVVV